MKAGYSNIKIRAEIMETQCLLYVFLCELHERLPHTIFIYGFYTTFKEQMLSVSAVILFLL